jgi:hypothetical protein
MENVWDYPCGNQLSQGVWDTYDAIVEACAKAWRFLTSDPDRIRSIAHREWANVNIQAGWYKRAFPGWYAQAAQTESDASPPRLRELAPLSPACKR